MDCWARDLGGCDEVSREHYISKSIFDDEPITVFGLSWCRDKPVSIGIESAVAKILCSKHNSELSLFDSEAGKLATFLKGAVMRESSETEIRLRGDYIEKWAIKTCLNLGYLGNLSVDQPNRIDPPPNLVEYLFQGIPVGDGCGLYFTTGHIAAETWEAGLFWNAIRNRDKPEQVVGMAFTLYGVRFVVSLLPIRAENKIADLGEIRNYNFSEAKIFYRPTNIVLENSQVGRKIILLAWK